MLSELAMKKLSKHIATTISRTLSLETTTLKPLSGEQLVTAQGGIPFTRMECNSARCVPPTNICG